MNTPGNQPANMIPVQRKKGASSNYTQGVPHAKHMGYTNSMSGQL